MFDLDSAISTPIEVMNYEALVHSYSLCSVCNVYDKLQFTSVTVSCGLWTAGRASLDTPAPPLHVIPHTGPFQGTIESRKM